MAMRCKRCRDRIVIEIRRHNAAFCRDCFFHYVRQQVTRAIDKHHMLRPTDRVLVAVSGGKDSLALWDLLLELGYRVDGLYMALGIGGYSERSKDTCQAFADARGAELVVYDLSDEQGYTIPEAAGTSGKPGRAGKPGATGAAGKPGTTGRAHGSGKVGPAGRSPCGRRAPGGKTQRAAPSLRQAREAARSW